MKRLILVALMLALGIGGCAPRNPTLDNPPHGSFNLTVDKISSNGTVAAHNPYFPKLEAPVQAFADVGLLPNRSRTWRTP